MVLLIERALWFAAGFVTFPALFVLVASLFQRLDRDAYRAAYREEARRAPAVLSKPIIPPDSSRT